MTTTITQCNPRCRAFTMVEVMIASSLGTMIMVGVLSTFLMLGRSGANVANYSTMETESRRALEELSQDVRMAAEIVFSAQSVTLKVPDNYMGASNRVTYAYDSTTKEFYRKPGFAASTEPRTILIRNVNSCTFSRFNRLNASTNSDVTTKRLQITLVVRSKSKTVAAATNTILSASYVLRNKPAN